MQRTTNHSLSDIKISIFVIIQILNDDKNSQALVFEFQKPMSLFFIFSVRVIISKPKKRIRNNKTVIFSMKIPFGEIAIFARWKFFWPSFNFRQLKDRMVNKRPWIIFQISFKMM